MNLYGKRGPAWLRKGLLLLLIPGWAALLGAQDSGSPERLNREILEGILRERGVPFRNSGASLLIPQGLPGNPALVLAVPLARPGETSPGEGPGDLPLRFAAALSLVPGPEESPGPLIVFLGGQEGGLEQILETLEIPGPEGPPLLPEDRDRRPVLYLDIGAEQAGGTLAFGAAGAPPLAWLLPIPGICEALEIPWSLGGPFLASGTDPADNSAGRVLIRAAPGGRALDGALLGDLIRRYGQALGEEPEEGNLERNYLLFPLPGKLFIAGELALALGFLALALIFCCGFLFLPPARPGALPASALLWLCMLVIGGTALYRLSLYPFYGPALIPAFAARSLRRPLPRRLCAGLALLCLGMTAIFLRQAGW